jgi:hypothetical protein
MRPNNTPWVYSESVSEGMSRRRLSAIIGCSFLLLGTHCAVYDNDLETASPITEVHAGQADPACEGGESSSTTVTIGGKNGDGSATTAVGGRAANLAGQRGSEPSAGGNAGGEGSAGAGGSTSAGTSASAGGSAGAAGASTGSGGDTAGAAGSITDSNLSRGKPATTDSEQSSRMHYARDANDGDRSTRWCATDWRTNHYWEVDLGSSFSLSSVHVLWEKQAAYLFKIETSADRARWTIALDKTQSSSAAANQDLALPAGVTGRYVRVTVTGGLTTTVWASIYELDVFGH